MAVFDLTAYRLSYLVTTPGYDDENGDYHPGSQFWEGEIKCNLVPAGEANEIKYEDGKTYIYSYTVTSLPRDCREFTVGDRVRIRKLNGEWQNFTVKGFHRYQLQCKMWV